MEKLIARGKCGLSRMAGGEAVERWFCRWKVFEVEGVLPVESLRVGWAWRWSIGTACQRADVVAPTELVEVADIGQLALIRSVMRGCVMRL